MLIKLSDTRDIVNYSRYSGLTTVGIVLVKDKYDWYLAFIGCAGGIDEETDAISITQFGAAFPMYAAKLLFPYYWNDES